VTSFENAKKCFRHWQAAQKTEKGTCKWNLEQVFQPHPIENTPEEEDLIQLLEIPYQPEPPIKHLRITEVQEIINILNPRKSPGYDLITGKSSKNCSLLEYNILHSQLFNAVLLKGYFPAQWKVAQIILIQNPAPPPPRANILSPNKPSTYHIQSPR
jgi:hypothetical protein